MADSLIRNAGPRVLVVEDDRGVARMLSFALREAGFQVSSAGSGGEALTALESGPVDAVVLDLGLPDNQGGEVLGWLRRRQNNGSGGPVWVVMSALDRREAARQYGPQYGTIDEGHFVAKPFDPWQLARLLNELLGR